MGAFDTFVIFAEMRTGSNFLEANLNALDGLTCHGEAFNPHFIGYPNRTNILDVTMEDRDADPLDLIDRLKSANGLNGFRFFNDHDPRVFDAVLSDPRCAKIILTRNPVDSFVSLKIARSTDQWKLTDVKRHREDTIEFEKGAFQDYIDELHQFQAKLLNTLQKSGQTAFHLNYEHLHDLDVLNGLITFLGVAARANGLDKSLKRQNPKPLSDKVKNFAEMEASVRAMDWVGLARIPNFELGRGPALPAYVAAPHSPLMYLPIKSGPTDAVKQWLAKLDDAEPSDLITRFSRKSLRRWKQESLGHRSFTVVRHPVARAHAAFCEKILATGEGSFRKIRKHLRQKMKLPIPTQYPDEKYGFAEHKLAFLGFLKFVNTNLNGQTAFRVDPHWATQSQVITGFAEIALPDMIAREDRLVDDLSILAGVIGQSAMPDLPKSTDPYSGLLAQIYDTEIEKAARTVYQRDYIAFGFGPYR